MTSFVRYLAVCVAAVSAALSSAACGPSPQDVARLRDEGDDGPGRLAAIVRDAKGSAAVQQEAALALVTLTRRNRHVGLELLADALAARGAESRAPLIDGLSAELTKGMALARTPTEDPALAHEDGAYLLVSHDLAAGAAKQALASALQRWLEESTMDRLDDPRHRYGVRSLLHALGPAAAKALLRFFDDERHLPRALDLVLGEGDADTKQAASVSIARLSVAVHTPGWREAKRPDVESANKAMNVQLSPLEVDSQLRTLQSKALQQVFRALERLAYPSAVSALLTASEDRALKASDRVVALQSLGKQAGLLDGPQLDRILAIATTSALAGARSRPGAAAGAEPSGFPLEDDANLARAALTCAAGAPAARPKLLAIVASPSTWRLRMETASALLREARPSAVDEVLERLPARADVPMALAELTAYGAALAETPEGKAAARAHLGDAALGARLVALTTLRDDRAALTPHEKDDAPLPRCAATDPCEWTCDEARVTTVGQYVRACLEAPASTSRRPQEGYVTPQLTAQGEAMVTQQLLAALTGPGDGGADAGIDAAAPPPKKP